MSEEPMLSSDGAALLADQRALLSEQACDPDLNRRRARGRDWIVARAGVPEPVETIKEIRVSGVRARLYSTSGGEDRALVWFHEGGWWTGGLETCDAMARALANRAGCTVVSVDYRLVPEHPYPAAVEDSWNATAWAAERFDQVAIGGASSGGNLATVVALKARDAFIGNLVLQILVYPVIDAMAVKSAAYAEFERRYHDFGGESAYGHLCRQAVRAMWERYVPDARRRTEPDASPAHAVSIARVAPALIVTAEHDILRREAEDYARRLRDEGVSVGLHRYDGQVHGFFHLLGLSADARDALERCAASLRAAFSGNSSEERTDETDQTALPYLGAHRGTKQTSDAAQRATGADVRGEGGQLPL